MIPPCPRAPLLPGLMAGLWLLGCGDPLREEASIELGPEVPGIARGPLHRAGQPCLVCHDGGAATAFSVAGTVYRLADADEPASGVVVSLIDARGAEHRAATNCAGNFFVRPGDYSPEFPLWIAIERGEWRQVMDSPVNGDGSCAACHAGDPGPASAGRVFLLPFEVGIEEEGCP